MKYIKPLDGYRAVAVGLVIIQHWFYSNYYIRILHLGFIGVTMFFVLSGFLITSILLKSNEAISEGKITPAHAFKTFYVRRTLRIFPAYYLTLVGLCLFYPVVFSFDRSSLYYFFTYSINVYMYINMAALGLLVPLWSLAVEEQFYLIWPLILLLTNKKHHFKIMLCFIIGGLLFRIVFSIFAPLNHFGYFDVLTPSCIDSFAIGAMLSLFYKDPVRYKKFTGVINWLSIISLAAFLVLLAYFRDTEHVTYRLPVSILSVWLLMLIIDGQSWVGRKVFSNPLLVYMGKISYGIYLVHLLVPGVYMHLSGFFIQHGYLIPFTHYSLLPFVGGKKQFILYFAFMMFVTSFSWYCFERPINNLKRFFGYNA